MPQYNPSTVVVYSAAPVYGYYPTAYPAYYYPYAPGAALAAGVVWVVSFGLGCVWLMVGSPLACCGAPAWSDPLESSA